MGDATGLNVAYALRKTIHGSVYATIFFISDLERSVLATSNFIPAQERSVLATAVA